MTYLNCIFLLTQNFLHMYISCRVNAKTYHRCLSQIPSDQSLLWLSHFI